MPWTTVIDRTFRVADRPDIGVGVLDLGLACCALEFDAAVTRGLLTPESEDVTSVTSRVLVVSGTLTRALAPALERIEGEMLADATADRPLHLLAFGACAISGGPYWDAPTVVPGVSTVRSVANFVPGCPPRPEALVDAIIDLVRVRG